MATAGELIKGSLRLLGVLAEGEEPSADTYTDSLAAFNQMLDSWSTERLSVFGLEDITHTWPSGQVSQTLGPSSDIEKNPTPVQVDASTYYIVNGISYGLTMVSAGQYNSIPQKTLQTGYPEVMWANMILDTVPKIQLTLYPVPSQDLAMHIMTVKPITQFNATSDAVYLPQGYQRALRYNLAMELAPEFGVPVSSDIKRIASASKRNIKRINSPGNVMSMPGALVARNFGYNVYTGGYQ